jgi:hypothetical protein
MAAPPDRQQILAFARQHGDAAAARKWNVQRATIRQWRHRAKLAAQKPVTTVTPVIAAVSPPTERESNGNAEPFALASGWIPVCARCHGSGELTIPPTIRAVVQAERAVSCPDCGGPRPVQVTTYPAEQGGRWEAAMLEFGDATSRMDDADYRHWVTHRPDPADPRTWRSRRYWWERP